VQLAAQQPPGALGAGAGAGAGAAGSQQQDGSRHCTTRLHCARVNALPGGGKMSVFGLLGAVCMHGVPLIGAFIDLLAPESFPPYILMLGDVLPRARGRIGDVYIDFACRLKPSWQRFIANMQGHHELQMMLSGARLLVPWMHAAGHVLSCQVHNNGRFALGAGRRVGENTEQLWSMFKVSSDVYSTLVMMVMMMMMMMVVVVVVVVMMMVMMMMMMMMMVVVVMVVMVMVVVVMVVMVMMVMMMMRY
jgi:hypothetical protein